MAAAFLVVAGLVFAYIAGWTTYIRENENVKEGKKI